MSPLFTSDDADGPVEPTSSPPSCPICGGPFMELRGSSRCGRCSFVICQGCEGDRPRTVEGEAADR